MMGEQKSEAELFNYAVNLEKRVRVNHPLRQVKAAIDFSFVREEVAHCYGKKGNESVPPEVILKMMFLLFFDDIKSERELMEVIGERLDYLWFLDYGLDEKVPDHSVLSKARARWGKDVFESLFVRTVAQCVEAGLVDGSKAACGCKPGRCQCRERISGQRCAALDRRLEASLSSHRK
jgi:transposase